MKCFTQSLPTQYTEEPQPKQKFTGYWIPLELERLGLNRQEQFLLAMIDSLDSGDPEYCFASNTYLAKKLELSESRVSFYITKLKRMGLIAQVGFDGRRRMLKSLKHNWYKTEVSKNELCVKTVTPTARKHEGRPRENTNHITNKIKEDYIKESIRVSPPPELPPDIPPISSIVSSTPIPAESSIPLDRNFKETDFTSDDLVELLNMQPEYTPFFRPRIVAVWITKFGSTMVLDTIKMFLRVKETQSKPIASPEAWMEVALKKKFTETASTVSENKRFAQNLKKKYNLRDLKINKRYCEITNIGKDFYYTLPCETFKNLLVQSCKNL